MPCLCILQYNTCFWALVKSGKTPVEAQEALKVRAPPPHLPLPSHQFEPQLHLLASCAFGTACVLCTVLV